MDRTRQELRLRRTRRRRVPTASSTRASILQRLLTHDAYHCGKLPQTLGIECLPQIDRWRPD